MHSSNSLIRFSTWTDSRSSQSEVENLASHELWSRGVNMRHPRSYRVGHHPCCYVRWRCKRWRSWKKKNNNNWKQITHDGIQLKTPQSSPARLALNRQAYLHNRNPLKRRTRSSQVTWQADPGPQERVLQMRKVNTSKIRISSYRFN